MSTSSSTSSAAIIIKLEWNSSVDAEDTFESVMAELQTSLIKESVFHCVSEADSDGRLSAKPPLAQANQASYLTRISAWEKSIRELNDDANKAMGTLMAMFTPECNAHRSLSSWFMQDIGAGLTDDQKRRKDFNFRNAWTQFYAEYRPNKQVNLDTILKKWEALTDEGISFAEFHGTYTKLIQEMQDIGQPPTEAKRYEMLRNNVKNPYLEHFVIQLSLSDARRISLQQFFEDCLFYVRFNKSKDSGHGVKRKHEEIILGRSVTVTKSNRDGAQNPICFRCGEPGHLKFNYEKKIACSATVCTLCYAHIGKDNHEARSCCGRSHAVFPSGQPNSKKQKKNGPSSSTHFNKKGKSGAKDKKSSTYVPKESSSSSSGLPKHVVAAMAVLTKYHAESQPVGRRVMASEPDDSSG